MLLAHRLHDVLPVVLLNDPLGHKGHVAWPSIWLKLPKGQFAQPAIDEAPVFELYLPAGQRLHWACPSWEL